MDFFVGDRAMLHAMGNDDELAFANYGFMIAKLHAQHSFDHEEQFVFNVVMVPDKLAFDFDDLHRAVIDDAYLALIPEIGESAKFFLKIYGVHGILPELSTSLSQCRLPQSARAGSYQHAKFRSTNAEDFPFRKCGPSPNRFRRGRL